MLRQIAARMLHWNRKPASDMQELSVNLLHVKDANEPGRMCILGKHLFRLGRLAVRTGDASQTAVYITRRLPPPPKKVLR